MAKYIGNDLLIQLNSGGVIASIGGSTEDTVTWSNEVVDTTDRVNKPLEGDNRSGRTKRKHEPNRLHL